MNQQQILLYLFKLKSYLLKELTHTFNTLQPDPNKKKFNRFESTGGEITTRLPHGQEKSGKTKKNDKSQVKFGVFEKSQEKVSKIFFKNTRFCQFKFTKFLIFKYLQLVKN